MNQKWIITPKKTLSDQERQAYWENTHVAENYETVWSMTEDPVLRHKLTAEIRSHSKHEKILIPGCGSRTVLERHFIESLADISAIYCTDYPGVIEVAAGYYQHAKVHYEARDSQDLGFETEFDVVVIVNSVLSESDAENRAILRSCYRSLKTGGVLIGLFPTIFAAVDIAYLEPSRQRLECVDLERSALYETQQNLWQIFYTPLRLRQIIKEAGYHLDKTEIFFCDSPYFLEHSKQYYGLEDPDNVVYELLVVAQKL